MKFYYTLLLIFLASISNAQDAILKSDKNTQVYIAKFKNLAMQEQNRIGMPAAIILAQGIYESQSGQSELAIKGNNHFGLKCKKEWKGETILHDDDAKQECFRKYPSAQESYIDHSNYLKNNNRYAFLFDMKLEEYKDWAVGLRKAGYATNPAYAAILVKIIEQNNLQQYTLKAINKSEHTDNETYEKVPEEKVKIETTPITKMDTVVKDKKMPINKTIDKKTIDKKIAGKKALDKKIASKKTEKTNEVERIIIAKSPTLKVDNTDKKTVKKTDKKTLSKPTVIKIETLNKIKGFYAKKGENIATCAEKLNINYKKLLLTNDLKDEPLPENMFIYLTPKPKKGAKKYHILQDGESLLGVAQKEGIQLASLRWLNLLYKNDMPQVGTRLQLQEQASNPPELIASNSEEKKKEETIVEEIPKIEQNKPEDKENKTEEMVAKTEIIPEQNTPTATLPEIDTPIEYPKSPSTYNEAGLSNEIKNLKRQMDIMVYAPPIISKKPKQEIKIVKPTATTSATKPTKPIAKKEITPTKKTVKENTIAIKPKKVIARKKETTPKKEPKKEVKKTTPKKEVAKKPKKETKKEVTKPKKKPIKKTDDE